MTNKITIVGAGMAGLLAANMLHRHNPSVLEAQSSLPNNHSAVLRFGSDKVAEVLGIPFKKVQMIKTALSWQNPVADSLAYARKSGGIHRSDRSITKSVERGERWIAPSDLIARMARGINITFDAPFAFDPMAEGSRPPIISTMPMPALMGLLGYRPMPEFRYVEGANIIFNALEADAYASLYVPDPDMMFNRVSITGNQVIAEYAFPHEGDREGFEDLFIIEDGKMSQALIGEAVDISELLGIEEIDPVSIQIKQQRYAKIQPIDDNERKKFLAWATDQHNIFSLGRFATWRPGLLLDDLVHDVRQIERWIGDRYSMRFAR